MASDMSSSLGNNLSELDRLLLELNAVQHVSPSFPTEGTAHQEMSPLTLTLQVPFASPLPAPHSHACLTRWIIPIMWIAAVWAVCS